MLNLFIDMDGTLTEFNPKASMEEMYTPGYFENLKPHMNVCEGIRIFSENHPEVSVSVLSCILPERANASAEKERWLEWYCPILAKGEKYFIPCGSDKSQVVKEGENFLLDDHSPNLIAFERAGHGIKLINSVNGQGLKWKGPRLSAALTPEEIADQLFDTMNSIISA